MSIWEELDRMTKREAELVNQLALLRNEINQALIQGTAERDIHAHDLTAKEREVMMLVRQGYSNINIGAHLNIKERTVKYHISNLLKKMGASSRHEL